MATLKKMLMFVKSWHEAANQAWGKSLSFTTCDEKYSRSLEFLQQPIFSVYMFSQANLHGNQLKVEVNFRSNKTTFEIQYTSAQWEEHSKALQINELMQTDRKGHFPCSGACLCWEIIKRGVLQGSQFAKLICVL